MTQCLTSHYIIEFGLDAVADLGVVHRRSEIFPELYLFKYEKIGADFSDPVVQECRGLILNSEDEWSVVARPYNKFFNLHEILASEISWDDARIYEKLDGSLIAMWWYKGGWRLSTTGSPDASGPLHDGSSSFSELFWKVWESLEYRLPDSRGDDWTYLFELMTDQNRVVVRHTSPRIVWHGARHKTGTELHPYLAEWAYKVDYHWDVVKTYSGIQSPGDALIQVNALDGSRSEGFVVCDSRFRRVKIKNPLYVWLHHLRGQLSPRPLLESILAGEASEILTYFPEHSSVVADYEGRIERLRTEIQSVIGTGSEMTDKEFAISIQNRNPAIKAGAFSLRRGKYPDFDSWFRSHPIKRLLIWLHLK